MDPQTAHPGNPHPASTPRVIPGDRGTASIVFAVIGLVINVAILAISVGCILHLQGQLEGRNAVLLFTFLGLMAGLGGIGVIWCIQITRNLLRFGPSSLTLENGTPEPGGILSARVECPLPIERAPVFTITLTCQHVKPTRTGPNGQTSTISATIVWKDSYNCAAQSSQQSPSGCIIPIRFDLPAKAPVTGALPHNPDDRIDWSLRVTCTTWGLSYEDCYTVPVFLGRTDHSLPVRTRPPPLA